MMYLMKMIEFSMCHCLYQVVNNRFPNNGLAAVGMVIFLRFINPAIVAPLEHGIVNSPPTPSVKRGLMLTSKILQNVANQCSFVKEPSMLPLNSFIQTKFDDAKT